MNHTHQNPWFWWCTGVVCARVGGSDRPKNKPRAISLREICPIPFCQISSGHRPACAITGSHFSSFCRSSFDSHDLVDSFFLFSSYTHAETPSHAFHHSSCASSIHSAQSSSSLCLAKYMFITTCIDDMLPWTLLCCCRHCPPSRGYRK